MEMTQIKSRAYIEKKDDWWIGWLLDVKGVNAQEKTKDELIKSLQEGAKDMLIVNSEELKDGEIEIIDIPVDVS